MLKRYFGFGLALLIVTSSVLVQGGDMLPYAWEAGDLALAYPTGWDQPLSTTIDGQPVLQLAQALVNAPDSRPPGIPFITLTLLPDDGSDFLPRVTAALEALTITPGDPLPVTFLESEGIHLEGRSPDEMFFGMASTALLPGGQVLVISGRSLFSQRDLFTGLFDSVVASIVLGADSRPNLPGYGVRWHTGRNLTDGADAFVDLVGAAYGPDQVIYTVDAVLGIVGFDSQTGTVAVVFPNPELTAPSAVAVGGDGQVFVGDLVCGCVFVLDQDGNWGEPLTGFAPDSPASLVASSDGKLYATNQTDGGIVVRVFGDESPAEIPFDETVIGQPQLAISPDGRLLALTPDNLIFSLQSGAWTQTGQLDAAGIFVNAFAVDRSGNYILAAENQGVQIYDSSGEPVNSIGRIVANYPLSGEVVNPRGVVIGPDGTVYVSDSDGQFGAVTAFSTSVGSGRTGASSLIPGVPVQGYLDEATIYQDWSLNAVAGETLTISAVDASRTDTLDVALRLIAPDGTAAAYSDTQDGQDLYGYFDAQLRAFTINAGGVYTVRVERVDGIGTYSLGVSRDQTVEISTQLATSLRGMLVDSLPVQRWVFQGKAGQILTVTMQAQSGTLDSLLRLIAPNGALLTENDDAVDTALGKDSQLVRIQLPQDGLYTLEAARFDGEGEYTLVIVVAP